MKVCSCCLIEQPAQEYSPNEYRCKACMRAKRKAYYYANLETERQKARQYHANDRVRSRELSAGYFRNNIDKERERKRANYRKSVYGSDAPIPDRNNRETWVYCCYDVAGRLIYVGLSVSFQRRLKEHAKSKSWWADVSGVTLTKCVDRQTAHDLEKSLIETHKPVHNVALKPIS